MLFHLSRFYGSYSLSPYRFKCDFTKANSSSTCKIKQVKLLLNGNDIDGLWLNEAADECNYLRFFLTNNFLDTNDLPLLSVS